jgi:hypothetical protein
MKYKLLKDLPFMQKDSIFGIGCWCGGGFGIDLGNNSHGSHNGVQTFEIHENIVLKSILDNKGWIEKIPGDKYELLSLYDDKYITREQMLEKI